jgi:hypothetical protein
MEVSSQLPARSGGERARAKSRIFYFEHNKCRDRAIDAALLIASLEELFESVISVGWNCNANRSNWIMTIHRIMMSSSSLWIQIARNGIRNAAEGDL